MRIRYFDRFELKYVIDQKQLNQISTELTEFMIPDLQGDAYGRYVITSLYLDTVDYKAYWDKIEGHRFRRKVRIRVYGEQTVTPETKCFAEIKQRINKTLQKKRILLPYKDAIALCGEGQPLTGLSDAEQPIADEILYLQQTLQLQPACVVGYHRLAFNGNEFDPGLRVTFDTNLKGRTHDLSLLSQGYGQSHFFIPPEWCIMEVKVNHRVPYWLTQMINRHRCTLRRISKYCTALAHSKTILGGQQIRL